MHPPGLGVQERNGASFVQKCLADPKRCKTNFRMSPESFMELHNILVSNHGLQGTQEMDTVEGLGMFLWAMGTQRSQRDMADRFSRALATVSTKFGEVLDAVVSFSNMVLVPKDRHYRTIHEKQFKYTPLFDGCIGAIDGTHVKVLVDRTVHNDFINRKGYTSQNVVAVCNFEQHFTYVGVGMARAVHDMFVLRQAWATPTFPHPPEG